MSKYDIIKFRRGTAEEWAVSSPQPDGEVLKLGEPGYEKDTGKLKIGDGTTPWNSLPYFNNEFEINDVLIFKGTLGTSGTITALPSVYEAGWSYKVITADTYAGKVCEIGDLIISIVDRSTGSGVNDDWIVVQSNIDGAVTSLGGTPNRLSKFSSSLVIEDSIISESGGIVNVSGTLNVNNISVSISGHSHFASDITDFSSTVSGLLPNTYDAAVPWTANHTLADGTRYLAGDLVYSGGNLYKAKFDNESIPVSDTTYWENVGPGYRLNIDGRDIPNIAFPVKDIIAGSNVNVSSSGGIYTISSSTIATESASLVTTVFNKTGSLIPKFSVIYISGGQGDMPTISLAIASTEMTSSKTYGVTAEAISNMTTGKVIVFGALTGVNTDQFNPTAPTGDVNGVTLYLSPTTPGGLTTAKPSAPNHMVAVGTIVRTHQNQGVVEVKIQNGFELEELHNVAISGVVDGQFLQYNTDSELWIPSSSGNFSTLQVNGSGVSVSGHTHTSTAISDSTSFGRNILTASSYEAQNKLGWQEITGSFTAKSGGQYFVKRSPGGSSAVVISDPLVSSPGDFYTIMCFGGIPINVGGINYGLSSTNSGILLQRNLGFRTGQFPEPLIVAEWTTTLLDNHSHTSSQITDFNTSVSGLLPTIANSGNNRLLTSDGTSTGINAESDFTFNNNNSNVNLVRFNSTDAFDGRSAIILTRNRGTSSTDQLPLNSGDSIGSFDFRTLDSSNQNSVGAEVVAYTNTGLSSYNHVPTTIRISNRNKEGTLNNIYIEDDGTFNPRNGAVINDVAKSLNFGGGRADALQIFNFPNLSQNESSRASLSWSFATIDSDSNNSTVTGGASASQIAIPSGIDNASGVLMGHSITSFRNAISGYDDSGNLGRLIGIGINYGHSVFADNETPTTTFVEGLRLNPNAGKGTISTSYDLHITSTTYNAVIDASGTIKYGDGTITNRYGIVQDSDDPNILNGSLTVSNGLSAPTKIYNLGTVSSNTTISYAIDKQIQTLTLNGTATNFIEGSGWPATDSVDVLLEITVSSTTSVTWTIVDDWYNPVPTLSTGKYLVLLRSMGATIQGHYIGEKTN